MCDGPPGAPDKVVVVLPDLMDLSGVPGGGGPREAHDAVLLVDPSPGDNFGHPVVLFYVDVNVTKKRCSLMDGLSLGNDLLSHYLIMYLLRIISSTCLCIIFPHTNHHVLNIASRHTHVYILY